MRSWAFWHINTGQKIIIGLLNNRVDDFVCEEFFLSLYKKKIYEQTLDAIIINETQRENRLRNSKDEMKFFFLLS